MITNNRLTRVHLLTFTQIHVHIILLLKLLGMFEHQQGNPIKNKKNIYKGNPKCYIVVAAALVLTILFF